MVDKDVRLERQKPSLGKQYLSVTINEAILTFLYNQGYRVGSKVGLSFIQRVEFQTNKRLYGDEKTQSETTRGKKDHRALQTEDHKRERERERNVSNVSVHCPSKRKFAGLVGVFMTGVDERLEKNMNSCSL